jgi:hypothetical protein
MKVAVSEHAWNAPASDVSFVASLLDDHTGLGTARA